MRVTALLFASYADAVGERTLVLDLPEGAPAAAVIDAVRSRAGGQALPPNPLIAVNEQYAAADARLAPGDVVAVLPPVAGG